MFIDNNENTIIYNNCEVNNIELRINNSDTRLMIMHAVLDVNPVYILELTISFEKISIMATHLFYRLKKMKKILENIKKWDIIPKIF